MKVVKTVGILLALCIALSIILAPVAVSYGIVTGQLDIETLAPVTEEDEIRYQTEIYRNGGF